MILPIIIDCTNELNDDWRSSYRLMQLGTPEALAELERRDNNWPNGRTGPITSYEEFLAELEKQQKP